MMSMQSNLDLFIGHIKSAATSRSTVKSLHILKARILMKGFSKEELKQLPELTDGLNGYELPVFWGVGIRNPARDATIIRVAERQLAAVEKGLED